MNRIVENDLLELIERYEDYPLLKDKSILITGATGHIAKYFTWFLLKLNQEKASNIKVLALVRNRTKAEGIFKDYIDDANFELVVQDVCDPLNYEGKVDYILHAAGSASAYAIKSDPVGIIKANTIGTENVLSYAVKNSVQKVLFTSTREVYGKVEGIDTIREGDTGCVDPMNPRNCYPESKRLAEALMCSYKKQYGLDFCCARIAHTYGPGMTLSNDGRVMSDFINDAVNGNDIVLNSDGSAIRGFCYIADTIYGLLMLLTRGESGEAYNLANETEAMMIRDVARIITELSDKDISLSYKESDAASKQGYLQYKITRLCVDKLRTLGWSPEISLEEGIRRTLNYYNEEV